MFGNVFGMLVYSKRTPSSIVLYVCKTWILTLRTEHRLRVSENKIFECKVADKTMN
jgi:hypothetical protein